MRLLVQLADGRKNPVWCVDLPASASLPSVRKTIERAARLRAGDVADSDVAMPPSNFRLLRNGRPLVARGHESPTLADLGLVSGDFLSLLPVLRGGGGDGGSTCAESRSCYLEMYAERKPEKVDPKDVILAKWTNCSLSAEPLSPPCVLDKLGNLLNKEAVIKSLHSKSMPKAFRHIRGLRDVMDVKLTEIPAVGDEALVRFQCPISGVEMNGTFRFFYMQCCGHVLSQRALKQLKGEGDTCPMCYAPQANSVRVPINGTEEEVEELRQHLEEERAKAKAEKDDAKKKKKPVPFVPSEALRPVSVAAVDTADKDLSVSRVRKVGGLIKAGGATQTLLDARAEDVKNAHGKDDLKGGAKKCGMVSQQVTQANVKRFKAGEHAPAGATKEVYASIFTSSRKEEFQETYSCRSLPLGRN